MLSLRSATLVTYLTLALKPSCQGDRRGLTCGLDNTSRNVVYQGKASIDSYPWLGVLFYPINLKRIVTTGVILVSKQIVIAAATEIDKLPKEDFRALSRVVLGQNCNGTSMKIQDYTYHPDYTKNTFSALAMIQLDVDNVKTELRPICPPPSHLIKPLFYAMALSDDCNDPSIRIFRMRHVNSEDCMSYYRKSELDIHTMWPTHTTCAKAFTSRNCVWRSGTALVLREGRRWRLLGFGTYGPGCKAPARFLDYGMYHSWVHRSISRIGHPAVTRIGQNEVILRRSLSTVQRYGPCDKEEVKRELYTDQVKLQPEPLKPRRVRYNVSIYANVEYSCVVFRATNLPPYFKQSSPKLRLRRWCAGPTEMCFGFQFLEIHFYVELYFSVPIEFKLLAYGKEAKIIDPKRAMLYTNNFHSVPPIYNQTDMAVKVRSWIRSEYSNWFT